MGKDNSRGLIRASPAATKDVRAKFIGAHGSHEASPGAILQGSPGLKRKKYFKVRSSGIFSATRAESLNTIEAGELCVVLAYSLI